MTGYLISEVEINGVEVAKVRQSHKDTRLAGDELQIGAFTVKRGDAPSNEDGTLTVMLRLRPA